MREAARNAGYNLDDKTDEDMVQYANAFMTALCEEVKGQENKEIKQFLQSLVETTNSCKLEASPAMWGNDLLSQRAVPWGKRVHMLFIVNRIIQVFKQKKKDYLKLDSQNQDPKIVRQYHSRENLLNFVPND